MSLHDGFRFVFEKAFDPGEAPRHLEGRLRRNLEVRGVRPAEGMSYDETVERILKSREIPVQPFDHPAWRLDESPYQTDPDVQAELERRFAELRDEPLIDLDPVMDGVLASAGVDFKTHGKPSQRIYCERFEAARGVDDTPATGAF